MAPPFTDATPMMAPNVPSQRARGGTKMPQDRIGVSARGWQRLTTSLANNAADFPHLEGHRARLAELLTQVQNLGNQQAALTRPMRRLLKSMLKRARPMRRYLESMRHHPQSMSRLPE